MIEYKKGNILDQTSGLIAHGCNLQNKMNSGLAKQIREKYPKVYQEYIRTLNKRLGGVDYINITTDPVLWIANCYTQESYGTNRRYADYPAIFACLNKLCHQMNSWGEGTLHLPKIGCGLAGDDWAVVEQLLKIAHDSNGSPSICIWES